MKCPECTNELEKFKLVPNIYECKNCNCNWNIYTTEQLVEMGKLGLELFSRNDLSVQEKVKKINEKSKELETNT